MLWRPVVEPKVAIQLANKVSFTVPLQSMLARTIERLGPGRKLGGDRAYQRG